MSVRDVIKKSFLESDMYNQAISTSTIATIVIDILVAVLIGYIIYWAYKKFFSGVVYSRNFGLTLMGMTVLTCMITLAISTNVVISLGMVGALSIVRFRTAIKEPLDLLYLFWAISSGIAAGASMYILLVVGSIVVILMLLVFNRAAKSGNNYIMVVCYKGEKAGDEVIREISRLKYTVRSKLLRGDDTELTVQIKTGSGNTAFIENINKLDGVSNVSLIQFDGEYHD